MCPLDSEVFFRFIFENSQQNSPVEYALHLCQMKLVILVSGLGVLAQPLSFNFSTAFASHLKYFTLNTAKRKVSRTSCFVNLVVMYKQLRRCASLHLHAYILRTSPSVQLYFDCFSSYLHEKLDNQKYYDIIQAQISAEN